MKYLNLLLLTALLSINIHAQNQSPGLWNGKACAVSLTYDDGLYVHLDKVIPALEASGFRGTFYIPGNASSLNSRRNDWKGSANRGHELGNHTVFHPCNGKSKGRDWVAPDYDLDHYSITRITDEIKLGNTLLGAIDHKTKRTFAYTCGDKAINDSSFVELIENDFVGARDVISGYNQMEDLDYFQIKSFSVNGQTAEELIALVKQAEKNHSLLVFLFHGVGGEHTLNISLEEHNKLLQYLKDREALVWVSPLVEILEYVQSKPAFKCGSPAQPQG